jgi:hypothetical protein
MGIYKLASRLEAEGRCDLNPSSAVMVESIQTFDDVNEIKEDLANTLFGAAAIMHLMAVNIEHGGAQIRYSESRRAYYELEHYMERIEIMITALDDGIGVDEDKKKSM